MKYIKYSGCALLLFLISNTITAQYQEDFVKSGEVLSKAYDELVDGDTISAMELYSSIHESDTNYHVALLQQISIYNSQKKYDKSMPLVQKGLRKPSPEEYRFLLFKGSIQLGLEEYEKALETYKKGLEKYPFNHFFAYNIAITYRELEQYEEYFTYLKKTVNSYPFYASVHFELGHFALQEDRLSQALMSYIMGILLEPTSLRSRSALTVMNKMVTEKIELNEDHKNTFEFAEDEDDYSDIDNIIRNYVALRKEYKVKSKADLKLIRQIQVMMETLKYDDDDKGFWMQFYVNFYTKLWKEGMFENFSYYLLRPSDVDEFIKLVKKNDKKIGEFSSWAGGEIKEYFSKIPLIVEGESKAGNRSYYSGSDRGMASLGEIEDGKRKGCWYYFHPSGTIEGKGCYDDEGYHEGKWEWFNSYGMLQRSFTAKKGKFDGTFKSYTTLGTPLTEIEFVDGKKEGSFKEFYELGGIYSENNYKNDLLDGVQNLYYENGKLKFSYNDKEGKIHGLLKEFFSNGKIKTITKYVEGEKDSVGTTYFSNGQIYQQYTYDNGKLDGDYAVFYMDGTKESEGQYKEGDLLGEQKSYYGNGNIERIQRYDEEGKENGISIFYDEDGIKYEELDYKKGNIVAYRIFNKKGEIVKQDSKKGGDFHYHSMHPDGAEGAEGVYNIRGGKEGEWKFRDQNGIISEVSTYEEGNIKGERIKYYPNGKIRSKATYDNGNWEGIYTEFYNFGDKSEEGYGINDQTSGPYFDYSINGDTSDVLFFEKGKSEGWQTYYGVNGKLEKKLYYDYKFLIQEVYFDSNGVAYDSMNFVGLNGKASLSHPNGKLYYEATYSNGAKNGPAKWYHGNGKLWYEGSYINNTKHGTYTHYYPNGKIDDVYNYEMGKLHGEVRWYHENGKLKSEYSYKYGVRSGLTKDYSEDGILIAKINYDLGEIHGKRYFYDPNGVLDHIRYYEYGKIIGYGYLDKNGAEIEMIPITNESGRVESKFQNGKVSRTYDIVNGYFEGPYMEYYSSGKLAESVTYKDNNREGPYVSYYENGNKKQESNYLHDEIDGNYSTYYKDGKQKVRGKFKLGERHGWWIYYNPAGKITEKRYYYLDVLLEEQKL